MDLADRKAKKKKLLQKMRGSFIDFGTKCLKVRAKNKKIVPFSWNRAQRYLHGKLEEQLARTGRVRALVLKGRQQGVSTYVGARFYHKASLWRGVNVYILAHEQPASDNLFKIVDRYQEYNPLKPHTGKANAKELEFDRLGSIYKVATAGQKAGGRSSTGSLFHGSEVAFWQNAADHFAASVQGVPEEDETEIILETTANGPTGEFYERWQEAEMYTATASDALGENFGCEDIAITEEERDVDEVDDGRYKKNDDADEGSDYIAIFIPWFWQEEYHRNPSRSFKLKDTAKEGEMTEVKYAEMFGLNDGQMLWRRKKIKELRSLALFNQEYPATALMAFQNSGEGAFISHEPVMDARHNTVESDGPLIMGADPAGPGGDRFAICGRRGHEVEYLKWRNKLETAEAYQWCKDVIMTHHPARFYVDAGGIGAATLSLLKHDDDLNKHHPGVVRGVNFGAPSQHKKVNPQKAGPKNRRAEMWNRLKEWLTNKDEPVSIPDIDALQADITGPRLKPTLTNDIQLESKEDMRSRKVRSPDLADALALTFASSSLITDYVEKNVIKVYGTPDTPRPKEAYRGYVSNSNGWMS